MLKLFSYFRSSAAYRVRIALHWKGLPFEYVPVHLLKDGGGQHQPAYRKINPMGHVPALEHDGLLLAESVAIIQYLDDRFPDRRLIPADPAVKAQVVQVSELINSGIQPLQNLKVVQYIENELGLGKPMADKWCKHWIEKGLTSLETLLQRTAGTYCMKDTVTMADAFLVPQCFTSRRFGIRIEDYPTISRLEQNLLKLEPVQKAHPEKQPDFQA